MARQRVISRSRRSRRHARKGLGARELVPNVYSTLRSVAAGLCAHGRRDSVIEPAALVHDAYVELARKRGTAWRSPGEFCASAARTMRHLLVDESRRAGAGNGVGARLEGISATPAGLDRLDAMALEEALQRLHRLDRRQARLVELRFFEGMSVDDAAHALKISRARAMEEWRGARRWLQRELGGHA